MKLPFKYQLMDLFLALVGGRSRLPEIPPEETAKEGNVLSICAHSLSTVVDVSEKEIIEQYCATEGVSVSDFLAKVALRDAMDGRATMRDELALALGIDGLSAQPRIVGSEQRAQGNSPFSSRKQIGPEIWERVYFYLPKQEREMVKRHLKRRKLSFRYHGRLAVRLIRLKQQQRTTPNS